MRPLPKTLLGRTALYLGLIWVIGSAGWTGAIAYFLLLPLRDVYDRQIGDTIAMAQALLVKSPADVELPTHQPPFSQFVGLRFVADGVETPRFLPPGQRTLPREVGLRLQQRVGPTGSYEQEVGTEKVWIKFPAGTRHYWMVLPISPPTAFPLVIAIWVGAGFALSIGGAYLIFYQLTRRMQRVTTAVREVANGGPQTVLDETGPQEIRELSAGFNQMAADLRRHDAERRLMLAGISHDLRTPLTRLRLAAEMTGPTPDPQLATGMIADVEEMDAILKQFLDYARGGGEEVAEPVDLNEIVGEVCRRYAGNGQIVAFRPAELPRCQVRKLAMRRVVTNLVENAVRYGRSDIEVRTERQRDHVRLVVSDRGPGVAPDRIGEIAQPFVRGAPERSESGAGLGLSIVERIVRRHGGELKLRNRDGGGFEATVSLPLRLA